MRRFARTVCVVSLGFVLLVPRGAQAIDFCIDVALTGTNPDFILENFRLPRPGKCRSFLGVGHTAIYLTSALHGVACAASSGDHVSLTFTLGRAPELDEPTDFGRVYFYTGILRTADLGGFVGYHLDGDPMASPWRGVASGYPCNNVFIP